MILTTTDTLDGYTVTEYLGRVSATLFFENETEVDDKEREALGKITSDAEWKRANAVIGIKSSISSGGSVSDSKWCIHMTGTAVTLWNNKEQSFV